MASGERHPRARGSEAERPGQTRPPDGSELFAGLAESAEGSKAAREPTVNELMGGPRRPDDQMRKTVLWFVLAFVSLLVVLTIGVIAINGLKLLSLVSLVFLAVFIYVLIGLLRYRGVDPMAQFDPPDENEADEESETDI